MGGVSMPSLVGGSRVISSSDFSIKASCFIMMLPTSFHPCHGSNSFPQMSIASRIILVAALILFVCLKIDSVTHVILPLAFSCLSSGRCSQISYGLGVEQVTLPKNTVVEQSSKSEDQVTTTAPAKNSSLAEDLVELFRDAAMLEEEVIEGQRRRRSYHAALDLSDPNVRLYWARNPGDYCAGQSHFTYSFNCLAAEARYLDRTFVIKSSICLSATHNDRMSIRPMEAYYDLSALRRGLSWVWEDDFTWMKQQYPHTRFSGESFGPEIPSEELRNHGRAKIIVRDLPVSDKQWPMGFELCSKPDSPLRPYLLKPADLLKPAEELKKIVEAIVSFLKGDFVALHVRRGDKLDPTRWPHLDRDTRPEAIVKKLKGKLVRGTRMYLLTNEKQAEFFNPLKKVYEVYQIEDFAHLWTEGSSWFHWFKGTFNETPYFDNRMKVIVDYQVMGSAKKRMNTFNDLTEDPANGIVTSSS